MCQTGKSQGFLGMAFMDARGSVLSDVEEYERS
jgi:hypothetical protein